MTRKILIALALMLALAGGALAQDEEEKSGDEAPDKLAGKAGIVFAIAQSDPKLSKSEMSAWNDGKGWSGTVRLEWQFQAGLELPAKYRISWTGNRKWLSYKKPNPEHGRRGNLLVDGNGSAIQELTFKAAINSGKTFRIRIRPIYADKTRGPDATIETAMNQYHSARDVGGNLLGSCDSSNPRNPTLHC